jgi:hypothetical protein
MGGEKCGVLFRRRSARKVLSTQEKVCVMRGGGRHSYKLMAWKAPDLSWPHLTVDCQLVATIVLGTVFLE